MIYIAKDDSKISQKLLHIKQEQHKAKQSLYKNLFIEQSTTEKDLEKEEIKDKYVQDPGIQYDTSHRASTFLIIYNFKLN